MTFQSQRQESDGGYIAEPVLLFIGVLSADPASTSRARRLIEIAFESEIREFGPFPFTYTDYYNREMGEGLQRRLWFLDELFNPEDLHLSKILTGSLEQTLAGGAGLPRTVNLDPGYMSLARVALYTTKDRPHRLYLGSGIFGEATLQYSQNSYREAAHTYEDYRSHQLIECFNAMRPDLKKSLRLISSQGAGCRSIYEILGQGHCCDCGAEMTVPHGNCDNDQHECPPPAVQDPQKEE